MTHPPLVAQLVGALSLLRKEWKRNGLGSPAELERFVDALAAPSGTERQKQELPPEGGHAADVPLLLTTSAAAEALMLGERTVRKLAASGQLPTVKVGRSKRIPRDALVEWVRTNQEGAA